MSIAIAAREPGGTIRTNPPPAMAAARPTAELSASQPSARVARVGDASPSRPREDRPRASTASHATPKPSKRMSASPAKAKAVVVDRVPAAEVVALMKEHGVSRKAFAAALGVTVSRISEMTTDRRPQSHARRDRWALMVKAAKTAARAAKK